MKVTLAPALFALAVILDYYGKTAGHWTEMLRPLAVLVGASTVLSVVALAVTRRPFVASYLALLIVAVILRPEIGVAFLLGGLIVAVGALIWRMTGRRVNEPSPIGLAMPFGILVGIGVVGLVQQGAITLDDFALPTSPPSVAASDAARPSIHVLLLDGYPRADSLMDRFGIDNEPFGDSLRDVGFTINRHAESRFAGTELSLASSMMADADALDRFMDDRQGGKMLSYWREARRDYLVNVPTMDAFRNAGYELVHVTSQVSHTQWAGWDETIDSGQLTDVEVALLQRSVLRTILDGWMMEQQRDRLDATLDAWVHAASRLNQQVTLAHVMAPHPPFLYTDPLPCWYATTCSLFTVHVADLGISDAEYGRLMAEQLTNVNRRVLAAVKQIVAADPLATIVLLSDHGGRFDRTDNAEWHRTFLAARNAPRLDGPDGLFVRLLESTAEAAVDD